MTKRENYPKSYELLFRFKDDSPGHKELVETIEASKEIDDLRKIIYGLDNPEDGSTFSCTRLPTPQTFELVELSPKCEE